MSVCIIQKGRDIILFFFFKKKINKIIKKDKSSAYEYDTMTEKESINNENESSDGTSMDGYERRREEEEEEDDERMPANAQMRGKDKHKNKNKNKNWNGDENENSENKEEGEEEDNDEDDNDNDNDNDDDDDEEEEEGVEKIKEWSEWLKWSLYLAPNAILVLLNDILALYSLSYVTVTTYAIFMQMSLLFIVIVRYFFLSKTLFKSQFMSVIISITAMALFKTVEMQEYNYKHTKTTTQEYAWHDFIGIFVCMIRGILKACDLVYVEWFIHHLKALEFYEKQAIVSIWFVVCNIFILQRPLLDGFTLSTYVFVLYGAFFSVMIYLLILQLDALVMGFCQQCTVLLSVLLDVVIFKTYVSAGMWLSAFIVVMSISQYSLIQFETNDKQ
ncbi:hypothetical protein RFI_24840, partial [Reticulomyxa filosa]